ncbi:MAG: hypothetical protein J6T03_02010 [Bacteroidales bacterium]|nr:hypothetical protein [Bacteroidales bacterium]
MIFSKNNFRLLLAGTLTLLTLSACKNFDGDITVPAYIHLDHIDIVPQAQNAPSVEPGFYSSSVDAVQLVGYFEGDKEETDFGSFQLPFTTPILRHGTLKYLHAYPVIKQSGQAAFRVYYTFYQPVTLYGITLSPDSVTNLGTLNPDSQKWTLNANYHGRDIMTVHCEDYFEPTTFSTNFDTNLTWVKNDPENACTGQGYAMLHVADSESTKTFTCTKELSPNERNTFYLEIDYKSDLELWVQLLGFEYLGTTAVVKSVMTLYPTDEWRKVYINLGKTWSWFNYNVPLTLFFQASNPQGVGGNVYIDNVKVISMK